MLRRARPGRARGPAIVRAARGHARRPARLARRVDEPARSGWSASAVDPIALQVVTGALRAACEEMGAVLVRAAHSANIKERRDASTALFDPDGEMVMQAEHIPVHLGAMPAAVAAVLGEDHARRRRVDPQRPVSPAARTCPTSPSITPVFADDGELLGFAASRAHHADVGGRDARLDARRLDARSPRRAS